MVMFLWRKPTPPSRAMAMAMSDSVTVSMAAVSRGTLSEMRAVSRVLTEVSLGSTADRAGISRTSSNVSPRLPKRSAISPLLFPDQDCAAGLAGHHAAVALDLDEPLGGQQVSAGAAASVDVRNQADGYAVLFCLFKPVIRCQKPRTDLFSGLGAPSFALGDFGLDTGQLAVQVR